MCGDWKEKPTSNVVGKIMKLWEAKVNESEDVLVKREKTTSLGLLRSTIVPMEKWKKL